MLRHSPHHTHARCGETSDFSTSVMWRNLKLLNMWRNVRFLHISTMWRNLKLLHMWRNFRFLHICHAYKFKISSHDKFFSTSLICDICDKYQVCGQSSYTSLWLWSVIDDLQDFNDTYYIFNLSIISTVWCSLLHHPTRTAVELLYPLNINCMLKSSVTTASKKWLISKT